MSQYVVSTVDLAQANPLWTEASALFDFGRDWIGSAELAQMLSVPARGDVVDAMLARRDRLNANPDARSLLQQVAPLQLSASDELSARTLAARAAHDADRATDLATRAERALQETISATANAIGRDERSALVAAGRQVLTGLGYHLSQHDGRRSTGLTAERGHAVLAVLVHDGGSMEIDVAGLTGSGCAEPVAELQSALRAGGLELTITRQVDHGDARGGSLIQRAARSTQGDLPLGLVVQHETARPRTASAPTSGTRMGVRS